MAPSDDKMTAAEAAELLGVDAEERDDRAFRALRRAFTEEGFCCTDAIIRKVLTLKDAARGYFLHYMPRRVKTEAMADGFGVRLLAEIENNADIMDGWYACHKRDQDGGFPLMTENQAMRAATMMTLGTEVKFSPNDYLLMLYGFRRTLSMS